MARRTLGLREGGGQAGRRAALEAQLLASDQQQALVVERTSRLLSAGLPPPVPPHIEIFKKRAKLRQRVDAAFADDLLFAIDRGEEGGASSRWDTEK